LVGRGIAQAISQHECRIIARKREGTGPPWSWAHRPFLLQLAYTFGLLFGRGLYARYREDAGRFRDGYDDLLWSTGLHGAAELASRFGIDVRVAGSWRASLDVIRAQISQFEKLATP
jgi:oligoendopeptidase F